VIRRAAFVATLVAALAPVAVRAAPHLNAEQKQILGAYVGAIQHERYADAFRLLTNAERGYFRSAANFASIFAADDLKIKSFRIIGSRDGGSLGTIGLVSQNVSFFDNAHQAHGTATVTVPYGLIPTAGSYRIKDPYHPWKAFRATGSETTTNGLRVTARKVSLFAGRIEVLIGFANLGDGFVTLLPYGRSVMRDEKGTVYHPIATKLPALTDKQLYLGLRLAQSAQYTGALNFAVPAGTSPRRLELTIAPNLRDGADAPFEVVLPPIAVP
jgi:hypothetical protein